MNVVLRVALKGFGLPCSNEIATVSQSDMDNHSVRQLKEFLNESNGLIAFENALIIRPITATKAADDIESWNRHDNWKCRYESADVHETLFFAEDACGMQFGIVPDGAIAFLNIETGQLDEFSKSFDDWIERILADYDLHTGYLLMRDWQRINGTIPPRCRLRPPIPFVMGGEFNVENMRAIPIDEIMRFGADFARKIKDIPDGEQARIVFIGS